MGNTGSSGNRGNSGSMGNSGTVKPLYSGHPWDVANWLLYKGGLIIQCTFNMKVLRGTSQLLLLDPI